MLHSTKLLNYVTRLIVRATGTGWLMVCAFIGVYVGQLFIPPGSTHGPAIYMRIWGYSLAGGLVLFLGALGIQLLLRGWQYSVARLLEITACACILFFLARNYVDANKESVRAEERFKLYLEKSDDSR